MLNRGTVEPTAANAARRETTAETNASGSVLSPRPRPVACVTCIEPCAAAGRSRLGAASRPAASRGRSGARSDRAGCDTDPAAVTLLVHVRVQGFLLRSVGEQRVCGAAVDRGD